MSSISVSTKCATLEVSDECKISTWISGFASADLSLMRRGCPGVDVDRRILRYVIMILAAAAS